MDERPPVWVGHAFVTVSDIARSAAFCEAVGMRTVEQDDEVAVLELRGGTHILLLPGPPTAPGDWPVDLMVDDLDATHADWHARGLKPSPIETNPHHRAFTVLDPDGYTVTVNSNHVMGVV